MRPCSSNWAADTRAACVISPERTGHGHQGFEPARRGDEGRDGDRSAADHFGRTETFAVNRTVPASGLTGDDHARGDVVSLLTQKRRGLKAVSRQKRLLATGAAQVAQPAGQASRIDSAERIGARAEHCLDCGMFRRPGRSVVARPAMRRLP